MNGNQESLIELTDAPDNAIVPTDSDAEAVIPREQEAPIALTVAHVEAALASGDRKRAIELRCELDGCSNKELWMSAFEGRAGAEMTKRTAYNRWRESRDDTPSWADELMRARLLR